MKPGREQMYWIFLLGIIALFSILLGPGIWRMSRRSAAVKRRANAIMLGRRGLTAHEFATRFFPSSQQAIAATVSEVLAGVLIVDVARVWPDDRLVGDLGMGQVDGLDAYHFDGELRTRFGISVLDVFKTEDPSVREVIECISRRLPNCDPAVHGRPANPWWNRIPSGIGFLVLAALLAAVFIVIALS